MTTKRVPFKVSLLPLAESLDAARLLANSNPITAPQSGVYGTVSVALRDTLAKMAGISRGERMYEHLIEDGMTVAEARRATEPATPMPEPTSEHGDREYRQLQHEMAWTPERYGGRKG